MVKPMSLELRGNAGQTVPFTVGLSSTLNRPEEITAKLWDLGQNIGGAYGPIEGEAAKQPPPAYSCLSWISLKQATVPVPAMSQVTVEGSIRIPTQASGFYAACVSAQTKPPAPKPGTVGLAIRFVIPIYVWVGSSSGRQNLKLEDTTLEFQAPTEKRKATTVGGMRIHNLGTAPARVSGRMRISWQTGATWHVIADGMIPEMGLLPGVTVQPHVDLGRPYPSGNYRIQAELQADGRRVGQLSKDLTLVGDPTLSQPGMDVALILEPALTKLGGRAGLTRTGTLKVTNPSDQAVSVTVATALPGSLQSVAIGELKGPELGCADWTVVEPATFTLAGGGRSRVLRVTARCPATGLRPNAYAEVLFAVTFQDGTPAGTTRGLLWVFDEQAESKLTMGALPPRIAEGDKGKYPVTADLGNMGNVHVWPAKCEAAVVSADGRTLASCALEGAFGIMLPMATSRYSGVLDVSKVPAGNYFLKVTLEEETGKALATTQTPVAVKVVDGVATCEVIAAEPAPPETPAP